MKSLSLAFFLLSVPVCVYAGYLKSDEKVNFYPRVAYLNKDGKIEANLNAWVYENALRPGARSALALWLKLDLEKLSPEEMETFEVRTQLFRFDSERNKNIKITFDQRGSYKFPATDKYGFSHRKILLNDNDITNLKNSSQQVEWLSFNAMLPASDTRRFSGQIMFLPNTGLSVISDIDDTVKDSHVLDHHELMMNTFVRPFKSVVGMADIYNLLAKHDARTSFHYISGSPHQLYPVLQDFLRENCFPQGSLHLRRVKVREELFTKSSTTQRHKLVEIRVLLEQFPQRQFMLIGDSGESDPETYAEIASAYPKQIIGIYIRDVTGQLANSDRYQKTFAGVPAELWHIFVRPDELASFIAN